MPHRTSTPRSGSTWLSPADIAERMVHAEAAMTPHAALIFRVHARLLHSALARESDTLRSISGRGALQIAETLHNRAFELQGHFPRGKRAKTIADAALARAQAPKRD